jgi:uncharacterized protein YlaI
MCEECYHRISEKTKARLATGKFRIYRSKLPNDEW